MANKGQSKRGRSEKELFINFEEEKKAPPDEGGARKKEA